MSSLDITSYIRRLWDRKASCENLHFDIDDHRVNIRKKGTISKVEE